MKFTSAGYVRLSVDYHQGQLEFEVADSGAGIPPREQERVFDPFRQVNATDARSVGGVGLGLAIVREVVKAMGGEIHLESAPGLGTRFLFRTPAPLGPAARPWVDESRSAGSVLLVARPSGNVAVLKDYLHWTKWSVTHCENEMDARQCSDPPALILVEPECLNDVHEFLRWTENQAIRPRIFLLGTLSSTRLVPPALREQMEGTFTWPATPASLKRLQPRDAPEAPASAVRGDFSSNAVLVVDDNPINRKVAGALLGKLSVSVDLAESGAEAVELFRRRRYSLVLMDCQMPEMSGFETTQQLRSLEKDFRTPIYGVSAYEEAEVAIRCGEAGMDGFLPKPLTLRALETLVAKVATGVSKI